MPTVVRSDRFRDITSRRDEMNGVLTLRVREADGATPRRIAVAAAGA